MSRVCFVAVSGSKDFYRKAAKLEDVPLDAWMRTVLHAAATEVFEAHGRDMSDAPPVHLLQRPPRLQPRYGFENPDDDEGPP